MAPSKVLSFLLATLSAHQALALIPSTSVPISQVNQLDTTFWNDYESGAKGPNPQITYKTTEITSPLFHTTQHSPQCDSTALTLLTPSNTNTALLLDARGNLVYAHEEAGAITNLRVQTYNSAPYLTFWTGDASTSWHHGAGYYKMLDTSYNLAYVITAVGHDNESISGDYHEFSITADNTALITAYVKTPWNLTYEGGHEEGWIWDCVVQEIDIITNALIFEWRASQHFAFDDMIVDSWSSWTGIEADPWDFFHINSASKDTNGNYLISAKFSRSIIYISGEDGEVIWELGGQNNTFEDLSQGNATRFVDPHHATLESAEDNTFTLTVFDTEAHFLEGREDVGGSYPMASKIQLHMDYQGREGNNIAKSLGQFINPNSAGIVLQGGSISKLDSGDYLVGYGSQSAFAEFTEGGQLLCQTQYAPFTAVEETEASVKISSYSHRVYKSQWIGHPNTAPSFFHEGNNVAWSWNGATGADSWRLEGQQEQSPQSRVGAKAMIPWTRFGMFRHAGFETSVQLPASATVSHETGEAIGEFDSFRLTAVGSDRKTLGSWIFHRDGSVHVVVEPKIDGSDRPATAVIANVGSDILGYGISLNYSVIAVLGVGVLAAYWLWRRRGRVVSQKSGWRKMSVFEVV